MFRIFDFRIMPDFGGGQSLLYDGYVEGRFHPAAKLRAGKFKPPLGLERLQSAIDMVFVERAAPTLLVPNRDVGVQLGGEFAGGKLDYAVRSVQRRDRRSARRHRRRPTPRRSTRGSSGVRSSPPTEALHRSTSVSGSA